MISTSRQACPDPYRNRLRHPSTVRATIVKAVLEGLLRHHRQSVLDPIRLVRGDSSGGAPGRLLYLVEAILRSAFSTRRAISFGTRHLFLPPAIRLAPRRE